MTNLPPARLAAWRSFLEAHSAIIQVLESELQAEAGMPLGWYDVLVHLSEAPDRRLRMRELATRVLLSKSGLTRLVQRMEQEGLVDRAPCDDDRRGTWAILTEAGYQRLKAAFPSHAQGVALHFADLLHDDEVEIIHQAMARITDASRQTLAEG